MCIYEKLEVLRNTKPGESSKAARIAKIEKLEIFG